MSRGWLVVIVIAAAAVALVSPVYAATVAIDQFNPAPIGIEVTGTIGIKSLAPTAQSFTPTVVRHVGVELLLQPQFNIDEPVEPIDLQIRDAVDGGIIAFASTTPPATASGTTDEFFEWVTFTFAQPVDLAPGQLYFITPQTETARWGWGNSFPGTVYPRGTAFTQGTERPDEDFMFRTLVERPGAAIPLPAAAASGAWGLVILGGAGFLRAAAGKRALAARVADSSPRPYNPRP